MSDVLKAMEESCDFANNNKDDVASYCEEVGVSASKEIIPKVMEKANIKYVGIKDCYKEYNSYFEKLNEFDAKTIGGKIPDEGVYMEK